MVKEVHKTLVFFILSNDYGIARLFIVTFSQKVGSVKVLL